MLLNGSSEFRLGKEEREKQDEDENEMGREQRHRKNWTANAMRVRIELLCGRNNCRLLMVGMEGLAQCTCGQYFKIGAGGLHAAVYVVRGARKASR